MGFSGELLVSNALMIIQTVYDDISFRSCHFISQRAKRVGIRWKLEELFLYSLYILCSFLKNDLRNG
jgi:hypothetical protein